MQAPCEMQSGTYNLVANNMHILYYNEPVKVIYMTYRNKLQSIDSDRIRDCLTMPLSRLQFKRGLYWKKRKKKLMMYDV